MSEQQSYRSRFPLGERSKRLVGQLALTSRRHPERAEEVRRELKAARLEDHIRAVVDSAPPLTAEQRDRLALILRGRSAERGQAPVDEAGELR